jgi:RHS repeat-associated protein
MCPFYPSRYLKFISVIPILFCITYVSAQNIPSTNTRPVATPGTIPIPYTATRINYIRTWEPTMPVVDPVVATDPSRTVSEVKQSTEYFDGMGRPIQTVNKGASGTGKDIVMPVIYDDFGREQFKYLPYIPQTGNNSDGNFKSDPFNNQRAFYQDNILNPGVKDESIFYSQTDFEYSPLNRVLATYAPGNSWAKGGGNHPVSHQYLINTAADSVRIWHMTDPLPVSSRIYSEGQLDKTVTIDENGGQTIEYKNKANHIVLKKVQLTDIPGTGHMGWLCTYYVYDDLGNLRFIIPPLAVQGILTNWNVTAVADELCFQYRFDGFNRMIEKKIPGAGIVEMTYDVRDRVVAIRDGNLKAKNQWLVNFYDQYNRVIETALYNSAASRETLQTSLNSSTGTGTTSYQVPGIADLVVATDDRNSYVASNSVTLENGFVSTDGKEINIYIDPALKGDILNLTVTNPIPGISPAALVPLKYTFYDNYSYPGVHSSQPLDFSKPQAGSNLYQETITGTSNATRGFVTGTKVWIMDTNQWLTTTTYYNERGRVIQTIGDNSAGGKNVATSLYDFSGKLLSTYQKNTNPRSGATPLTSVLTMMAYDHAGRLTSVKKRINDNASLEKTVATNDYDDLGQLKTKVMGLQPNGQAIEQLSYERNIRGWLKSVNKDYLNNGSNLSHFGQEFNYDYGFNSRTYNNNISGIRWKGWNDPLQKAYGYSYDKVNRLTQAYYTQQNSSNSPWTKDKMDFTVPWINYDANGNITKMSQKGMDGTSILSIDQLAYSYYPNSNKISAVFDTSMVSTALGDFKDGNKNGVDYTYDPNGNLSKDLNKAISAISYNHLNLPVQINIDNKGIIRYQYDAAGNKLKKEVTDITVSPAKTTTTSYVDGFVYQDDVLQFLGHEEGRVRWVYKTGVAPSYVYDYFVRDHLGNTRLVLTEQTDLSMYAATMEVSANAKETALFSNIEASRIPKPVGYPADDSGESNESVARLNAKEGGTKIGPSLVLRVMRGDTIQIGARAFYKSNGPKEKQSAELPAENMLADLVHAFGGQAVTASDHNTGAGSNQTPFNTNFYNNDYRKIKEKDPSQNQQDKPKAYLNYVLFDDQFNLVEENSGVKQVKGEPDQLQTLAQDKMPITKSGFLYVYTSNESQQDVFFDNIVVTQATGKVLEETHYYPFGLTMAGLSSTALKSANYPENRIKYNGKELQHKEFGDGSGLEWYDFGARMYDQQVGRWMVLDAQSEKYSSLSPFNYSGNNPVLNIDVTGNSFFPSTNWMASLQTSLQGQTQKWVSQANHNYQMRLEYDQWVTTTPEGRFQEMRRQEGRAIYDDYMEALRPYMYTGVKGGVTFGDGGMGARMFVGMTNLLTSFIPIVGPASRAMAAIGKGDRRGAIINAMLAAVEGGAWVSGLSKVSTGGTTEMTTVGRWMSNAEYETMSKTGRIVEGAGGQTFVATGGPGSFKAKGKGSVYAEFQIETNSLIQGGQADWFKAIGPNAGRAMQWVLEKQGGQLLPQIYNLSPILIKL